MEKFMFLIREDLHRVESMSEEELAESIRLMTEWVGEISATGNYMGGDPLDTKIAVVKKDQVHTDGPPLETREGISGYLLITARSMEQAIEIAGSCPEVLNGAATIEVRPLMKQE